MPQIPTIVQDQRQDHKILRSTMPRSTGEEDTAIDGTRINVSDRRKERQRGLEGSWESESDLTIGQVTSAELVVMRELGLSKEQARISVKRPRSLLQSVTCDTAHLCACRVYEGDTRPRDRAGVALGGRRGYGFMLVANMAASVGSDTVIRRVGSTVRNSAVFHKSKRAASNTGRFSRKLLWSTGKAAWIAGTSFLVLIVPLIIEMDRDQQMVELESQQAGLLGAPPSIGPAK